MSKPGKHLAIASLREEIRRIENRPGRRDGFLATGLPAVDALLPGGGFPCGALSELAGGPASGKTAVALTLFASLGEDAIAAYVDARGELYPPAAAALGVDLARLLVIRPGSGGSVPANPEDRAAWRAALWASEILLACGAFAAVAMDLPCPRVVEGGDAIARRLQGAAERGGTVGLWLATRARGLRVSAAARIEVWTEGGRIAARNRPAESRVPAAAGRGGHAA